MANNYAAKSLYVSGMPLELSGFEGEYKAAGRNRWERQSHNILGGLVTILPTVLEWDYRRKRWILQVDAEFTGYEQVFYEKVGGLPFGEWQTTTHLGSTVTVSRRRRTCSLAPHQRLITLLGVIAAGLAYMTYGV